MQEQVETKALRFTKETSSFKKPLTISRKKPENYPSIGKYDQLALTIQEDVNKMKMKNSGKCKS